MRSAQAAAHNTQAAMQNASVKMSDTQNAEKCGKSHIVRYTLM
jgi:hypothetical protein